MTEHFTRLQVGGHWWDIAPDGSLSPGTCVHKVLMTEPCADCEREETR